MLHEEGSFIQCGNAKAEMKTMKARTTWQCCCILFSIAMAVAPIIQAADQERIHYARAIGEEPTPSPEAPVPPTKPAMPEKGPAPAKPTAEKAPEVKKEESKPVSKTAVWIGIGLAAVLAAAGGGGGGGGGSTTPPHP